jgi:predicted TIM-barrel fold metal-dependent hydrolase
MSTTNDHEFKTLSPEHTFSDAFVGAQRREIGPRADTSVDERMDARLAALGVRIDLVRQTKALLQFLGKNRLRMEFRFVVDEGSRPQSSGESGS